MNKRRVIILLFLILSKSWILAQEPIHIADLSYKMDGNSSEEFYCSFAEGDVMVIDFELYKGKGINLEIVELPSHIKANLFTANLTNYRISVPSTNVYLFKITNGKGKKTCSLHLKRIPKSEETTSFNTGWQWKTIYDTSYTRYQEDSLVRHDTVHYTETVKEVASKELTEVVLVNNIEKIHSNAGALVNNIPRISVTVCLPQNQYENYWKKEVIGWGYWICVGNNSNSFWNKNKNMITNTAETIAGVAFGPLGAFIAGEVTTLFIPDDKSVDAVSWRIVASKREMYSFMNGQPTTWIRYGDGPGAFGKILGDNTQGTYYICMYNHNHFTPIHVNVKASAVVETTTYKDVDYERTKIVPKYVKLTKRRRNISSRQVRVPAE